MAAAFFALLLILGFHTRLTVFMSWVLLVSLHNRNPMILQGGDTFLRGLLFWSLFVPLEAGYSIDNRLRDALSLRGTSAPRQILNPGTFALCAQIIMMYWVTAAYKSGVEWHSEGTALFYALSNEEIALPAAKILTGFPHILRYLTHFVYGLEILGPLLLVSPIAPGPIRTLGVLLLISFHLGIAILMKLGLFPFIDIASLLLFLPSWFWDRVPAKIKSNCSAMVRTPLDALTRHLPPVLHPARPYPPKPFYPFILFALIYVFAYNLSTLQIISFPKSLKPIGNFLSIHQRWKMFSRSPAKIYHWFAITATQNNNITIDLMRNGEKLNWAPPPSVASSFKNYRWRKYLDYLMKFRSKKKLSIALATFLCKEWNHAHSASPSKQISNIRIYATAQPILLANKPVNKAKRYLLTSHSCNKKARRTKAGQ